MVELVPREGGNSRSSGVRALDASDNNDTCEFPFVVSNACCAVVEQNCHVLKGPAVGKLLFHNDGGGPHGLQSFRCHLADDSGGQSRAGEGDALRNFGW